MQNLLNKIAMKSLFLFLLTSLLFLTSACSQDETVETSIAWDKWGVPHIYADFRFIFCSRLGSNA